MGIAYTATLSGPQVARDWPHYRSVWSAHHGHVRDLCEQPGRETEALNKAHVSVVL